MFNVNFIQTFPESYKEALMKENSAQYFSNSDDEACAKRQKPNMENIDLNHILRSSQNVTSQDFISTDMSTCLDTQEFCFIPPGIRRPVTSTEIWEAEKTTHESSDEQNPLNNEEYLCSCCKEVSKELNSINKENKEIKKMLSIIMQKVNNIVNTNENEDSDDDVINITVQNYEELAEINRKCLEPKYANRLVKQLSLIRLPDEKSALRILLQNIAVDDVFLHMSWQGTEKKFSFMNLKEINSVMFKVIKKSLKNYTAAIYEQSAKAWLRHAQERKNRSCNKENNTSQRSS